MPTHRPTDASNGILLCSVGVSGTLADVEPFLIDVFSYPASSRPDEAR